MIGRTYKGDTIVIDLRELSQEEKTEHDLAARKLPKVGKKIREKQDAAKEKKHKDGKV